MQQYILRRSLLNIFVLFLVATMVFGVLRVDSDNVVRKRAGGCLSGTDPTLLEECLRTTREELGLDKSIPRQYWNFISGLVQLDLGHSTFGNKDAIFEEIKERAPASVELGLLQIIVALTVALPIGIISAIRQDTWVDYILRFFSIALLGIPVFVLAVVSILLLSRYAEGSFLTASLSLRQDYVRAAWAKGLRERVIIVRHALKNALIPVLTIVGILLGAIVSGNVILEYIYRIQ